MKKWIFFDYGRTLYDRETDRVFPDAHETLTELSDRYRFAIVSLLSAGETPAGRMEVLRRGNIGYFFEDALFVSGNKDAAYEEMLLRMNVAPWDVTVVGDRIKRDVAWGNSVGARMAWFRNGKFKDEFPDAGTGEPHHAIEQLSELAELI
jgi:FMN phosphatase YigB (HAD superfamily)